MKETFNKGSPIVRTYTFKLYNRKSYRTKFNNWIGCCRFLYNLGKEAKDFAYENFKNNLSYYDLANQLKDLKKEYPFLKNVYSQTLQLTLRRLDNSYQMFLKNPKEVGYPKFAKRDTYKSFEITNVCNGVRFEDNGIRLSTFGTVKVFGFKRIEGKVKLARVICRADDIYVQMVIEEDNSKCLYTKSENQVLGIDMGVKFFLTDSNGHHVDNPRHLFKYLKQLRILQRSLSRKVKGSNNRKKTKLKIQKLHLRISNVRKDFHHKLSTKLATENSHIVIEDLNIQGMSKSNLAKHILDCGWGQFFTFLEYKCNLIRVNPRFTSQMCSSCGHIAKENRKTQSKFVCVNCAHTANADVNAAHNIKKAGVAVIYSLT